MLTIKGYDFLDIIMASVRFFRRGFVYMVLLASSGMLRSPQTTN